MNKLLSRALLVVMLASVAGVTVFSQEERSKASLDCRDNWHSDKLVSHCEIKEQTLPATDGTISVDGRMNGGVSVQGWDRNEILVRARIQSTGSSEAEATELARQVKIETAGSKIFASGPPNRNNYWWSVSYEVFVPRRSNLSLKTNNGGISISDVTGQLEFSALNGGVNLKRIGGTVRGSTTNGGLNVELSGDRWDGEALDVKTTNGGVSMSIPENYSAHLETGTVNGRISIDFPVTIQGDITRELAVNLGSGGATIRAMTTNGGVKIRRKEGIRL
ncbi:MAG TPA: DUF4097 family beta strand repeat-containing protein [Pyrinomonadaceae bacterium]|jgi:hypothetical protein